MTLVVSDTSPLRALNHLGLLPVLGTMFARVVVPPAVQHELSLPRPRFAPVDLGAFSFMEVTAPSDAAQIQSFRQSLDAGESEALALALELHAEAILIDEAAGRNVATQYGIPWIGTLGILIQAKHNGHVAQIGPLIDRLVVEQGFLVSAELRRQVLALAGE